MENSSKFITQTKYGYNDVTLVPSVMSEVISRRECVPYYEGKDLFNSKLPIFTAPMASVVSDENYQTFLEEGITPIIPRNIDISIRKELMKNGTFIALSLSEFEDIFCTNYVELKNEEHLITYNVCVDVANGHMLKIYNLCSLAKRRSIGDFYNVNIITGNIANPKTYEYLTKLNQQHINDYGINIVDGIRLGIGGGSVCITTSNVAVHYPQASLINECYCYKNEFSPKIIADGGIRNYSDVIKALALGADYVMIGSVFACTLESAGEKYDKNGNIIDFTMFSKIAKRSNAWVGFLSKKAYRQDKVIANQDGYVMFGTIYVKMFGMASADGQRSINGSKTKTSEGITKRLAITTTLHSWSENMSDYLRSAMSYCNSKTLDEFIGNQYVVVNSIGEINAVNK